MDNHRFVFLGGMPRSGTSALYQLVGSHPEISRLTNTNMPEDEGQYLQDVYPTGVALGAPGRYGLNPQSRLTETSPLAATAHDRLFAAWAPYWDLSKPILCEKSPANITRPRFLQAAFPNARFIFLSRHPVAYSLAIRKWDWRIPVSTTIRNWLACHHILEEDRPHLHHCLMLRYDELLREPVGWVRKIEDFIGVGPGMDASIIKHGHNTRYFRSWAARDYRDGPHRLRNQVKRLVGEAEIQYVQWRYEQDINKFGYSFHELQSV